MGDVTKFSEYTDRYMSAVHPEVAAEHDRQRRIEHDLREARVSGLEACGLTRVLPDADFAAVASDRLELTPALVALKAWAANLHSRPWLCLSGGTGLGKSLALASLAATERARYATAEELSRVWGANYGPQADEQAAAKRCRLLLIDDVGTELDQKLMKAALLTLMSSRGSRTAAPTVITTNLTASTFTSTYNNERIISRLNTHVQWVALVGKDRRKPQ